MDELKIIHQEPLELSSFDREFYPYLIHGAGCWARSHTRQFARLIAAAPDLLAACKAFVGDDLSLNHPDHTPWITQIRMVRGAIDKAEGSTNAH